MPRHGMNYEEKSKDFKGSMLRLFKNLDRWRVSLAIGIVLALLAAVLATIAPNKLADVTDVISDGIKLDVSKLQDITEEIYKHNFQDFTYKGVLITADDQKKYVSIIGNIGKNNLLSLLI